MVGLDGVEIGETGSEEEVSAGEMAIECESGLAGDDGTGIAIESSKSLRERSKNCTVDREWSLLEGEADGAMLRSSGEGEAAGLCSGLVGVAKGDIESSGLPLISVRR